MSKGEPMPSSIEKSVKPLVGVIDAGTSSVRFVIFSAITKQEICSHHVHIATKTPLEGWFEQDPFEILAGVRTCITTVLQKLPDIGFSASGILTVGVTNQRETTVVWDYFNGEPLYNAIVWSDIRTATIADQIIGRLPDNNKDYFKPLCGLPISPYFSALKLRWMIDNISAVTKAIHDQRCFFGTIDSWLIWNLTGGKDGGIHVTDVTNASRTLLMNIDSLRWDPLLCKHFDIPMRILPEIKSSSEIVGYIKEPGLEGICISGIIGNQQASLVGQGCLSEGQAKNTYRAGCFLLYNTGKTKVLSTHGLVTTVAFQLGPGTRPVYALEGSAMAGAAFKWLHENLNMMGEPYESEKIAKQVNTTADVYFVPAFTGLYAPYWRKDARGIICGLTQFTTKAHIIRAAHEAVCFQTRDILEAMNKDCGVPLNRLQADGALAKNDLLMQLQADLIGIPIVRTKDVDVVSLGAALIAGQANGINVFSLTKANYHEHTGQKFQPTTTPVDRDMRYKKWKMAVQRSLGWSIPKKSVSMTDERYRLLASIPGSLFLTLSFGILVLAKELYKK
ncbi:glycerol kinase 3-like isoform X4 [Lycorma delicatula]|uniref:glycerol kinase 3-like isoform X4 n=1 Tax=Lycorma delicatula TaxID=130591 RepID=UPI003F514FDE